MLPSSQELHQISVKNILTKSKEFDYDYETLKTLQQLEIRQFEEKSQLAEDLFKLRAEYNYKRTELDNNFRTPRDEIAQKLEEAKITLCRAELDLERAQMTMDHLLDSKAKFLEDLGVEYEERERKVIEEYEARKSTTLEYIQATETRGSNYVHRS